MEKLIALTLSLLSSAAFAQQFVPVKARYQIEVGTPTQLTSCQNKIWVYGKAKNQLLELNPLTGAVMWSFALKSDSFKYKELSALTCFQNKLLAAFVSEAKPAHAFLAFIEITNDQARFQSPQKVNPNLKRISDIQCFQNSCALASQEQVFISTNGLKTWIEFSIPDALEIPHKDIDIKTNLFSDWQEKLTLSKGFFTRVQWVSASEMLFLNPFRANVVSWTAPAEFKRWGSWGPWEGRLMNPKAMAVGPNNTLYVSDPLLKAIFVFTRAGDYLGLLADDQKFLPINFVTRMEVVGSNLWFIDLLGNKVSAVEIPALEAAAVEKAKDKDDFVRFNLFRREEVLKDRIANRCLTCHDGSVTDASANYLSTFSHHPVNIEMKRPTDLPLYNGNRVTCSSCHDPHHGNGDKVFMKKAPFLRKSPMELCLSCHAERREADTNHKDKKTNSCLECHIPHGGGEKMLKKPVPELCIGCHTKQKYNHRPIKDLAQTLGAAKVELSQEEFSCNTCHNPHLKEKSVNLVKDSSKILPLCASCHGQKSEILLKDFHKKIPQKARTN